MIEKYKFTINSNASQNYYEAEFFCLYEFLYPGITKFVRSFASKMGLRTLNDKIRE